MTQVKLTIGLIVKDGEEYLERCLASLSSLRGSVSSELIIADTGSTDRSKEIAREFTDRIYEYSWKEDFSAARNYVLEKAKGEWFLQLDADEIFEDTQGIEEFLNSQEEKDYNDAAYIVRSYLNSADLTVWEESCAARIFRRLPGRKYQGVIHEALTQIGPVRYLTDYVHHYGYLENSKTGNYDKARRNAALLEGELELCPDNTRVLWHLAREYHALGRSEDALAACIKALNGNKEDGNYVEYAVRSYQLLCEIYTEKRNFEQVIHIANDFDSKGFPPSAKAALIYMKVIDALMLIENYKEAVLYFNKLFMLRQRLEQQIASGNLKEKMGFSVFSEKMVEGAMCRYAKALINCGELEEALETLENIRGANGDETVLWVYPLWISVLRSTNKIEVFYRYFQTLQTEKRSELFGKTLIMRIWEEDQELSAEIAFYFQESDTEFACLERLLGGYIGNKEERDRVIAALCGSLPTELYYARFVLKVLEIGGDINSYIERCSYDLILHLPGYLYFRGNSLRRQVFNKDIPIPKNPTIKLLLFYTRLQAQALSDIRLDNKSFMDRFWENVENMMAYIRKLYHPSILTDEMCGNLPEYHCFIFLVWKASQYLRQGDKIAYIKYLKKAVQACPSQAGHIDRIIGDIEKELMEEKKEQKEFAQYAKKVKDLIRDLIYKMDYPAAIEAICAYEKINPGDEEITKLKEAVGL